MKIQYTLPGLIPAPEPRAQPADEMPVVPFRSRLHLLREAQPPNWRSLLRLDAPPVTGALIGPPPRPPEMEARDVASQRLRWRQMLDRHLNASMAGPSQPPGDAGAPDGARAVQRMLALLLRYQQLEDSVIARHLSERQG